jgi:hypothetical protein
MAGRPSTYTREIVRTIEFHPGCFVLEWPRMENMEPLDICKLMTERAQAEE